MYRTVTIGCRDAPDVRQLTLNEIRTFIGAAFGIGVVCLAVDGDPAPLGAAFAAAVLLYIVNGDMPKD